MSIPRVSPGPPMMDPWVFFHRVIHGGHYWYAVPGGLSNGSLWRHGPI